MSHALFYQLLEQEVPPMNPLIMNGLACEHMKHAEQYVDLVFKSAAKSFPEGLKYVGYERCTPAEEFVEVSRARNNKRTYDIARSDIYLIKYIFSFNGVRLPNIYIYLPFVGEAGIMFLNGAMYHVTPVLSDKVISPGFDSVFVRLLRDKIIFRRLYHLLIINDIRETTYVVWSQIHRKTTDKKIPETTRADTCIVHYLFGQYGFTETFKKYCNFVPIVGTDEIDEDSYPRDKYVICQSTQIKPKTFIGSFYEPTNIRVAIPIEHWTARSKSFIISFFYIVDHFPTRIKINTLDNISLWRILLGHIIYSGAYGENKLYTNISEHFVSLNDYIDNIVKEKLKETGYIVDDFYDLLALLSEQFNNLVLDNENAALSMYGKSLEVLYYMHYNITSGIFKVNFGLGKIVSKKPLTIDDVKETLNKNLKPRSILNLASGKIITESVSYSGDHKYFKLTSKITEQESLPGATRGKSKRFVLGQDKHLDISMVECGSILFLPKSNPSPANKINPWINIDPATGTVLPNPKFNDLRERIFKKLKGRD